MNYFASKSAPAWSIPKPQELNAKPKLRKLEIPLPSLPRRYQSGDGPRPPAPLSMILKNDSTAHIFEKRVLAGPPKNGELSLQMHYVVGWSDLPAARVAIQARHILDYVSPRVLEDFEYSLYLEREAREEEEEVAAAIAAVAAAEAAENAAAGRKPVSKPSANKWKGPRRRKKNRPSKADLIAKKQAEETSFNQSEAAAIGGTLAAATQNANGPSLAAPPQSTPKKKKNVAPNAIIANSEDDAIMDDVDEQDEMEVDDEVAIMRQLRQTSTKSSEGFGSSDSEVEDATLRPTSVGRSISIKNEQMPSLPASPRTLAALPKPAPALSSLPEKNTPSAQSRLAKSTLQHYGFTPAAKSTVPWPMATGSQMHSISPNQGVLPLPKAVSPTKNETKPPRSKGKKKVAVVQDEEEQVWEVKALEDMQVEVVDGRPIRWFKVRWKGDWPPDQNPTWEPEENIDKPLVKKYLAKVAAKGSQGVPTNLPPSKPQLKRKYSSVAEAVMGDMEDEGEHRSSVTPGASSSLSHSGAMNDSRVHGEVQDIVSYHTSVSGDDDEDDDILEVTGPESRHVETPGQSRELNEALMRELETSFRRQDVRRSSGESNSS